MTLKLLKQAGTMVLASTLLLTVAPRGMGRKRYLVQNQLPCHPLPSPGQVDTSALDAKITKEQALERAKTYITLPADYTFQSISLNAYYGMNGQNIPTWNISYTKKVKDRFYGSANISINGLDGTLTSYSMNDNDPDHKPVVSAEGGFSSCEGCRLLHLLAKVNPEKQKELVYDDSEEKAFRTPLDGNYQYNIRYDRSVGGVPFLG